MEEISFNCDDVQFEWHDEKPLATWLNQIITHEKGILSDLSYVYCSDERLLEMNKDHLNHDFYTDVITFDLSDNNSIEGEIYISLDRITENATTFRVSFEEELCRVMAHGLLHLLGYQDHSLEEKSLMQTKEAFCLSLLPEVPRGAFM